MVKEDLKRRTHRCLNRTVLDSAIRGAYEYWLQLLLTRDPEDLSWVNHATRDAAEHGADLVVSKRSAANALAFWFHCITQREPLWFSDWSRVFRPAVPRTLSVSLTARLFEHLCGLPLVACQVMTHTGLRPDEVLALRVRNICLAERVLSVSGAMDTPERVIHIPHQLNEPLRQLICEVRKLHQWDCERGGGWAPVPPDWELSRPRAGREFAFQFLFPRCVQQTESLTRESQRRPISVRQLGAAVRVAAGNANITAKLSPFCLRHTYARSLAASGWSVSRLQAHLGQSWTLDTLSYFQSRGGSPEAM